MTRTFLLAAVLLTAASLISVTTAAADSGWLVRTARMEGAAGNLEETAASVRETAAKIQASGRVSALAALHADADELNRRVISAQLAADVLDRPL